MASGERLGGGTHDIVTTSIERIETLRHQRGELEEAIGDLERTCEIVDGMLRERTLAETG